MLIKEVKKLQSAVTGLNNMAVQYHERAHVVAISVLLHTATHGQVDQEGKTDVLHRFYNGLRPAYQAAFKQYVREHCGKMVKTVTGTLKWEGWLSFQDKTWGVVKGATELRQAFEAKSEKLEADRPFYDRDPSHETPAFTDMSIMRSIESLLKRAQKACDETHTISPTVLLAMENAKAMIENTVKQAHTERSSAPVVQGEMVTPVVLIKGPRKGRFSKTQESGEATKAEAVG